MSATTTRGRKPKITAARVDKICNLIRAGHYKNVAAQQGGIDERTFYKWYEKGDPKHPQHARKYRQFRQSVDKAEADSEVLLVDRVLKGGPREALEILKRRFPERWGDRHRLEHAGAEGAPPIGHHHSGTIDNPSGGSAVQIIIAASGDARQPGDDPGDTPPEEPEARAGGIAMPGETDLD